MVDLYTTWLNTFRMAESEWIARMTSLQGILWLVIYIAAEHSQTKFEKRKFTAPANVMHRKPWLFFSLTPCFFRL